MTWWSRNRPWFERLDWSLVLVIGLLMTVGIAFIRSASYSHALPATAGLYEKQVVWVVIGLLVFAAVMLIDYHAWGRYAGALYGLGLVLLVLVLVVGRKAYGASRWLSLFGLQIQPSEFAKLATILMVARFLARPGRDLAAGGTLVAVLALLGVPFLLILKEPDLGTALVFAPVGVVMLFVAGLPWRRLALLGLLALLLLPVGWFFLSPYQHERILVFLQPDRDPFGAGWNKMQSIIAVGSGGFWGKGYMQGTQNILGYLPRTVAPTDFIYAVLAEEMGFAGAGAVVLLFMFLLVACARAAFHGLDKFGRLLASGIMALFFYHVFVNLAMTIGLMPVTGLPLPLLSYGGSFMLSTMMALGLVQSVYVRRYYNPE